MTEPRMYQFKPNALGAPTPHIIRFQSTRWIVEGGIQRDNSDDVVEFTGTLFDKYHFDSHLCVHVPRADGWYRSEAWHGFVSRDGSFEVIPMDREGNILSLVDCEKLFPNDFWNSWKGWFRTKEALATQSA